MSFVFRVLCLALALAAVPAHAFDGKTLRIASEGARPPFNYLDGDGKLMGFEIDLGRELCKRLAVDCVFAAVEFDSLVPGLVSNHFDAIMAAMEISDERRTQIEFSKPYVRMPSAFIAARTGDIHDSNPAGLAGRSIGVEANGPHQAWLEERYKASIIKTFDSLADAVLDLAEGRLDVALGDKDAVIDYLANHKEAHCCKFLADVPRDPAFFGDGIGIGLRKEDGDLKDKLDKALDAAVAEGTYAAIRAKYFTFEVY